MIALNKVLFLSPQPFFQSRGSPIRVAVTTRALAALGLDVDLLTLPIGEEHSTPGVRVIRVANPFRVKNIPIGPSAHKAIFNILILFKAIALALRNRYDVIHAVEETAISARIASWFCGARVIFERHSDPKSHRAGSLKNMVLSVYSRIEALAVCVADAVICTGPGMAKQIRARFPQKTVHHIFDLPSSFAEPDAARAQAHRAKLQKTADEVLALYVGSFAVYQGLDLMFDSMPIVLAENLTVRFVIIGGSPEQIAERKHWLAERGITDRVTFVGSVHPDELPDYLCAADLLLSPRSSGLNTPLKLLDYLKAERAIIATDIPANRQILDDACAELVAANPAGFAGGILRLADAPHERRRLALNGRKLMDETYNFEEFKRRLNRCYAALPASSGFRFVLPALVGIAIVLTLFALDIVF